MAFAMRNAGSLAILLLLLGSASSQNETGTCRDGSCDTGSKGFWTWVTSGDSHLTCVNASCTGIPLDEIDDPDSLDSLDLNHNDISVIPILTFPQLKYVDFSWNKIDSIEEKAFDHCRELLTVNMSRNLITRLDREIFMYLTKLISLEISHNKLMEIPSSLFFYPGDLAYLDLSHNLLPNISHLSLSDITALEVLHLDNNRLQMLERQDVQGLHNLKYLYLQHNEISYITTFAFQDSSKMLMINLTFNLLVDLTRDTFHGLDSLQSLHLSNNRQLKLLETKLLFHDTPKLERLYLDKTGLESISSQVFPESLKTISIQECPSLKTIQNGTFSGLGDLETVFIRGNEKLFFIDVDAFDGESSSVIVVDFSDNALVTLDETLLNWRGLTSLDLSNNQWNCDCHMEWMAHVNFREEVEQSDINAKCYNPHRLRGSYVREVNFAEFRCDFMSRYSYRLGVALIVMTTFFFVFAVVGLSYKYRNRVFPCWMKQRSHYQSLYSRDMDSEDPAVTVTWDGGSDDEKTALKKKKVPTATLR